MRSFEFSTCEVLFSWCTSLLELSKMFDFLTLSSSSRELDPLEVLTLRLPSISLSFRGLLDLEVLPFKHFPPEFLKRFPDVAYSCLAPCRLPIPPPSAFSNRKHVVKTATGQRLNFRTRLKIFTKSGKNQVARR